MTIVLATVLTACLVSRIATISAVVPVRLEARRR